jgi:hypothetical protein
MIKRLLLSSLLYLFTLLPSYAQRRLIVADVETLQPVSGVNVQGKGLKGLTDSLGCIQVSDSVQTLVFSHVNYESRLINLTEVRDTVYLISKLLSIKEVYVFGHGKGEDELKELKKRLRLEKSERQLSAMRSEDLNGNLLGLLGYLIPKSWKKNSKAERRKRLQEMLENY